MVRETVAVQARSALFDVYGDHLRRRAGTAPVASLIRLLGALDIAAPAVRTAISRMVRQGWLAAAQTPEGAGYQLTERAERRLEDAYERIYRTGQHAGDHSWDGRWHVLVAGRPTGRSSRERLGSGLAFLGYAQLTASTWIAPRAHPDVDAVLDGESVQAETFFAAYDGQGAELAGRAWDLDAVAAAYERFEVEAADLLAALGDQSASGELTGPDPDRTAFAIRSQLVHEWRKFLFLDPGLPDAVLPAGWPGHRAARLFDQAAGELLPGATRYVDACLQARSETRSETRSKEDA
jgi:phenylacetic acid degradation operon negative regulatory protein